MAIIVKLQKEILSMDKFVINTVTAIVENANK